MWWSRLAVGWLLLASAWVAAQANGNGAGVDGAGVESPAGGETPMALLQRMARARQELNYQGTFTYEHRSEMQSFRVLHWVENGRIHERLEYLNGPEGAVQEVGSQLRCRTTGYRLLNPEASAEEVARLERYYHLTPRGEDRIAGRAATILEVRPRDQLRYGYVLGLDRETGLLLKSLLFDEQQRLLERFQFVELNLNPDPEHLREQASSEETGTLVTGCEALVGRTPEKWRLNWVPDGFVYSGERTLSGNIDMLMYTDGLASFSVFLQPVHSQLSVEGRAQRGAISAYMGQLASGDGRYRVTVVGEIPGNVAEQLARGINRVSENGASE